MDVGLYNAWQEEYSHEAYRHMYFDGLGNVAEVSQYAGGVVHIQAVTIMREAKIVDGYLEGCDFTIEQAKERALFLLKTLKELPKFGRMADMPKE